MMNDDIHETNEKSKLLSYKTFRFYIFFILKNLHCFRKTNLLTIVKMHLNSQLIVD